LPFAFAQGQRQHDATLGDKPAALPRAIVKNANN
jgi:hypothetical protein